MLDLNLIRENPQSVASSLKNKGFEVEFSEMLVWDKEKRELIFQNDSLKARRNTVSAEVPKLKKEGKDTTQLQADMRAIGEDIKKNDDVIGELEKKITDFLDVLPNMPDADLEPGGKENNKVIRDWGSIPTFDFEPKNHVDIAESLGLIDYKRGVKLGGNGFWMYTGDGALLEWALINYFIEQHLRDGYEFILPPHMLMYQCGYVAGQFPKFDDEVFHIKEQDSKSYTHFLLPTSETALVNVHRDEILEEIELPKKYFAYTPCFRKEAGSYRAEERGMIRGHQFNKVEMLIYCKPEESDQMHEELVNKAEKLVQGLGIHHRVSKLAAGDCSHAMARTYDIELWIPSMNDYKEVSSASNGRDYQPRRGNIKFRRNETKKTEFVHLLNGSGLATSRLFPAILEQYQTIDGDVIVPEVLRKWVGKDILKKR